MGTLIIDVFDNEEKAMVWRGAAEGQIKPNMGPEAVREKENEAVGRILAEFPPKG